MAGDGMNARERSGRRGDGGGERTEGDTGEGRGKQVSVEPAQFTILFKSISLVPHVTIVTGYLTSTTAYVVDCCHLCDGPPHGLRWGETQMRCAVIALEILCVPKLADFAF